MSQDAKRSPAPNEPPPLDPANYPPLDNEPSAPAPVYQLRRLPIIAQEQIPEPPEGYIPLSAEARGPKLRSFPKDLEAESLNALNEVVGRGDQLQKDLGPGCPTAEQGMRLAQRAKTTRQALRRAKGLVEYLENQDRVNRHDIYTYLQGCIVAYRYRAKDKGLLAIEYPALAYLVKAIGAKVAAGIAAAKELRGLEKRAKEAQDVVREAGLEGAEGEKTG